MKRMIDGDRLMEPRININGMNRGQHVQNRLNLMAEIRDVMEALNAIRPHGRDYIGDNDAYERDLAIYQERFAMLDKLNHDIHDEALAIQEGGQ